MHPLTDGALQLKLPFQTGYALTHTQQTKTLVGIHWSDQTTTIIAHTECLSSIICSV